MKYLSPFNRPLFLLLALVALSFTACDDDDDVLGVDLGDKGTLFLSSNTTGQVGVIDTRDTPLELKQFAAAGMDADGIWYDEDDNDLIQINRSNSTLVEYEDVLDELDDEDGVEISNESTSNFSSGRGLAVVGGSQYIVAQSGTSANGDRNRLVLYRNTDDEGIDFVFGVDVDFALWGIQYADDKLYAVVDKTDSLAVFDDFFSLSDGDTAVPSRYIKIDGLVRTHGLEYDEADDIMLLTDVGAASSDTDGAMFVIRNFSNFTGDVITSADYTRIAGPATRLGNPLDVDYDEESNMMYVAERANGGGLLLVFDVDASGDVAPAMTVPFPGASSLYLNRE